MIGFVKGILEESRVGHVVVYVNGFGVIVGISESDRESLPSVGNEVKLYTHMSVSENDMSLYGFLSRDDLDIFEQLITVSGVGPKASLGLLGTFPASEIRFLILTGDSGKLSKAPGIGKKTAERIILELKDKVSKDDIITLDDVASGPSGSELNAEARDAVDALVSLGYSASEAKRAVTLAGNVDGMDTGAILKAALQHLY